MGNSSPLHCRRRRRRHAMDVAVAVSLSGGAAAARRTGDTRERTLVHINWPTAEHWIGRN